MNPRQRALAINAAAWSGICAVILGTLRLTWTHWADQSGHPALSLTEADGLSAGTMQFPWGGEGIRFLCWGSLALVAGLVLCAYGARRGRRAGRRLAVGTAAIVAIVILTAAFLLPGAGYSPKAFGGVGPGGPVVAAGLLLLGAAAWLAPVERSSPPAPASLPRLVLAGLLVVLSAALVAPALTIADWYNSLDDGRSYTIAFPDLGRSLANSADPSRLDRAFVPLVCFSLGIAAVAVVLALIRPVGTRALRAVAVGIGVLAPALLLLYFSRSWGRADLTAQGYVHDAPYNPFVGLHAGFWMYAGGCGLLVLAAVAAPPRKVAPALGSPA